MAEDNFDKSEEPTPRRLEKAREEGQVARSVELSAAIVLLTGIFLTQRRAPGMLSALRTSMAEALSRATATDLTPVEIGRLVRGVGATILSVVAPLTFTIAAIAFLATVAQIGIRLYPKRITPDPSKLSPLKGLQRIFSKNGLVELAKSVLKVSLVGWIAWRTVVALETTVPAVGLRTPREILEEAGAGLGTMLFRVVAVLAAIAILDYAWQRYSFKQSLRMSKTEVKQEQKQSEADPKVKQRLRRAYREFSGNKMLAAAARADVVVTNPTHFAVALRYDANQMGAPRVVAKGVGELAQRIKEVARQNGVPLVERRALARALYRTVKVGDEIPSAMYRAVAEILAYIYALQAQRAV